MGNIVTTVKRFSRNNSDDVPFRTYSSSPSTGRLDKCTSDKDSSVTGKTASAITTCANGCESVCKTVDNETIDLTTCSSSRSGCFTLSIAHTEPSGGDEQGQGKPNETIQTDAVEHRSVSRSAIAGFKSIPEDSGDFEMVAFEDTAVCDHLDLRGSECNPNTSLKRRAKRKRTSRKASAKKIVPTGNVGTSASPDVKYPEMAKLPIIPVVEQSFTDKALQLTPLMIRTPLPHVRSILTPGRAMVQSVPTLEALQLRRSRSGRLIVPRLDPGTQDIIYNMDGRICGVTNSELQLPRGCDSEPLAKKRRKPQCHPDTMAGRCSSMEIYS